MGKTIRAMSSSYAERDVEAQLMRILSEAEKGLELSTKWLMYVGIVPLFLMCLSTVVDVVGAKLFMRPIIGNLEIVATLQVLALSSAVAFLQIKGGHTRVDFLVERFGERAKVVNSVVVSFMSLVLWVLLTWTSFARGQTFQSAGQVTSNLRIPLFLPAYAMSFCFAIVSLVLLLQFLVSIGKLRGRKI